MYTNQQRRRKGEGMARGSSAHLQSHRPEMRAGRHDKGAKKIEQARRLVPKMIKKDDGTYVPYPTLYKYGMLMVDISTIIVKVHPLEKKTHPT